MSIHLYDPDFWEWSYDTSTAGVLGYQRRRTPEEVVRVKSERAQREYVAARDARHAAMSARLDEALAIQ